MAKITSQYLKGGSYLPSPSFSTFDDNDEFWNSYNSLNSKYRSQLDPYLSYSYKEGIWDKIGNAFGFNTAADKYRFQMQDRARQVLAGLQNDVFQNDYNSAQAQASRQRDAGLNPDLSGESSGEGAAQLEQPLSPIDPSIFDLPQNLIPNIANIFGTAANGLESFAQFMNLTSMFKRNKAERTSIELKNYREAFDYAGEYLSSFDPKTRIDYPDVEITPDFFNDTIVPAAIADVRNRIPGQSEETYALLDAAFKARRNDPELFDRYYKNAAASSVSHANKLATEKVYGNIDAADDVLKVLNKSTLDYIEKSQKVMLEYNYKVNSYNAAKAQNDWDYERWKYDNNVPAEMAEADLANYLSQQAEFAAANLQYEYKLEQLRELKALTKKGDPTAQWYLNAFLIGSYAPLLNTTFSAGAFGLKGSGSWNNIPYPGMDLPQNGLTKGMSPSYRSNSPFDWIDTK